MEVAFNPYLAFAWSILAGLLMSMGVGGGGILAGIGHISVLGITDANMIKVVNQILELSSRILSVPLYYRQRRLVWPLALTFGVGAPLGAVAGAWLSRHYVTDMDLYRPLFGVLVTLVALRMLYEACARRSGGNAGLRKARVTSERAQSQFRNARDGAGGGTARLAAPRTLAWGWRKVRVGFAGENFDFSPLAAVGGGFVISFVGSMLGVGGGFLVTPFMASVLLFPLFLVLGTSLVALMIPLVVSVTTYLLLDVRVDWWLVGVEVPGVLLGSLLGPHLNRHMNETVLRTLVAVVLFGIGVHYLV